MHHPNEACCVIRSQDGRMSSHDPILRDTSGDPPRSESLDHPDTIGPCKIRQVVGEGGMGIVYDAEQLKPVRRRVALKMMKVGMDTREVVARFEAERQALAMMDHPGIARVLDAGATVDPMYRTHAASPDEALCSALRGSAMAAGRSRPQVLF